MSTPRTPARLLTDMLDEAELARHFVAGMTLAEFVVDPRTARAVRSCVQIIGEAACQLDPAVKARIGGIPWPKVEGMRHLLVHHYFKINLPLLWATVEESLPALVVAVRPVRDELLAAAEPPPADPAP